MVRSPQAISSATVRRYMDRAGPTVAEMLEAVAGPSREGQGPLAAVMPLVDTIEQTKRHALQAGAREAAWLLYAGVWSCLHDGTQLPGLVTLGPRDAAPTEPERDLGRVLNRCRLTEVSLPASRITVSLAHECLDLADIVMADWPWTTLMRAAIEMEGQRWESAIGHLGSLSEGSAVDDGVLVHAQRNLIISHGMRGTLAQVLDLISEYGLEHPQDRRAALFEMDAAAERRDANQFARACERLRSRDDDLPDKVWAHWIHQRVPQWRQLGFDLSWLAETDWTAGR